MNATKRKFNALLNGIGNKSSTSLAKETTGDPEAPPSRDSSSLKKRRTSVSSAISTSDASQTSNTNIHRSKATPNIRSHQKSISVANNVLPAETPKYAPWDRAAFLKRLKSFSSLTEWSPKPVQINEVEWAKRGWVCQKAERVRCSLCNVEILVKLSKKKVDGKEEPGDDSVNIDALVDRYVEMIVTSHDEDCLWKKRGCDESIFKLPLSHAPTAIENLRERYNELMSRTETLPYMFNMRAPPELDLATVMGFIPRDLFTASMSTQNNTREVNKVAFLMALFGWQGHKHERYGVQIGSASCQACFRALGLWLFKSKEVNAAGEEVLGAGMTCLDVVKEHRDYCPWRNPQSQNGQSSSGKPSTEAMAGWEMMVKVLKHDHHLKNNGKNPARPLSRPNVESEAGSAYGADNDDDDAKSIRDEKDKQRWARLRRVKSLFETKGGKKMHRSDTTKSKNGTD